MPKLSKKINAPIVRKRSSIRLLDGSTPIKLPIAPNPVHMLQGFLKAELTKEKPANVARAQPALVPNRRPAAGRG
jgi:hypothetical protein